MGLCGNLALCRIPKTLTCKTCLFFLFFLELNFSFFCHFVYLPLSISYPVLLTLFAVAAILNASPSSLETRDLLCANRVGLLPSRRHIEKREDPGDEVVPCGNFRSAVYLFKVRFGCRQEGVMNSPLGWFEVSGRRDVTT